MKGRPCTNLQVDAPSAYWSFLELVSDDAIFASSHHFREEVALSCRKCRTLLRFAALIKVFEAVFSIMYFLQALKERECAHKLLRAKQTAALQSRHF